MRKFLKQVGVTSQQAIEEAMRTANDTSGKTYTAKMVLTIDEMDFEPELGDELYNYFPKLAAHMQNR